MRALAKLRHGLSSLDDLLCRASDWTEEQLWVWFGVQRKSLMKSLIVVYGLSSAYSDISKRAWTSLGLTGAVFVINYLAAASGSEMVAPPEFERICRALRLFFLGLVLLSAVTCILGEFGKCDTVALTALLWYMYVSRIRGNGGKRKERRMLLAELKKLFGVEWMPTPQPSEG